jgi:hypothetical protein
MKPSHHLHLTAVWRLCSCHSRIFIYFISHVKKTLNCVECLTLLLAVLLSVSLSCTFHTLHHQLVVHDDKEDKSWSATKEHTSMWLLKLNLFLSAELNGLTEICKISLMQKMEEWQQYINKINNGFRKVSGLQNYLSTGPTTYIIMGAKCRMEERGSLYHLAYTPCIWSGHLDSPLQMNPNTTQEMQKQS